MRDWINKDELPRYWADSPLALLSKITKCRHQDSPDIEIIDYFKLS